MRRLVLVVIGWQWCPGAYGQCGQCGNFVTGLWRYFATALKSTHAVCGPCAEEGSA